MPRQRTITGTIFNTAVFIILEIAALNMSTHSSSVQNFFLTKALHAAMGNVWGVTESISEYFSLRKENRELAEDIFVLNKEISRLNSLLEEAHLDSLARTGSTSDGGKFSFIPAPVVKSSTNKQHNYLIIGKGSEDGIREQSGIITPDGVVGIIDAVSRHYSYAISFLNSELSISARIGNGGAVGPMVWDGLHRNRAILKEIPLQYKFEEGDTVYTSGFSSIFPSDIPLGTTGSTKIVNGATYEVKINLFQDFSTLRYVTIVCNNDIKEIEELEQSELPKPKQGKGK